MVGNVVYAACQWGTLSAIAKLGGIEGAGLFALGLAIGAPVMQLASLGLRNIYVTDVNVDHRYHSYLATRRLASLAGLLVVCAIGFFGGFSIESALVIALVGLGKAIEAQGDFYHGVFQRKGRMDLVAASQILRGLLGIAALIGCLLLTKSLPWAIASMAVAWAGVFALLDLPASRQHAMGASIPHWGGISAVSRLAVLGLPLGMAACLNSFGVNIPRYFIEGVAGSTGLGIFASLAYIRTAGGMLMSALVQTILPSLAISFAEDLRRFARLMGLLALLAVGLGAGGLLVALFAGQPVLRFIYTDEVARHSSLFVLLMVDAALAYAYWCVSAAITAARMFRAVFLLRLVLVASIATASAALIPSMGLTGGALAGVCGSLAQLVAGLIICTRLYRLRKPVSGSAAAPSSTQ